MEAVVVVEVVVVVAVAVVAAAAVAAATVPVAARAIRPWRGGSYFAWPTTEAEATTPAVTGGMRHRRGAGRCVPFATLWVARQLSVPCSLQT